MAKKPITLQLDDDPPRVVNGKWLRVINDEDHAPTLIRISSIHSIMPRETSKHGTNNCVIDAGFDNRCYVDGYTPDQIMKIIMDAEFNEALEKTLLKGVG